MVKFFIGLFTGAFLCVLTAVIFVFSLAKLGTDRTPSVDSASTLVLELEGEIPERPPVTFPLPAFENQAPLTVHEVWDVLRKASTDDRIKAVVLKPRSLRVGWAKLQEIRADLEKFKKSGKPLVAFLVQPGTAEYYLASAADQIYMGPEENLYIKGLRAEMMYFRKTFDKLGVEVEIEHAGKYKDFGDMFVRESMSPETREVLNSVLDALYADLINTIAKGRKQDPAAVRATIDQGPYLAGQAKKLGLVDDLIYEDQAMDQLKKKLKQSELKLINSKDYSKITPESLGLTGDNKIAYVVGQGGISRGDEGDGSSDDGIGSVGFSKLLRKVADDSSIKGVVVRVDSPGGDAVASDDIWREMKRLSKAKPLVISMSDAAASGGYYMSMSGDPVLAYTGTFTGSIGVVYGKANLRGFYDKIGITKDSLTRGKFADIDSDYKPMSPEGRQKLREGIDATYTAFVSRVAEARKKPYEEIEPLAQGRVWLGSQAKGNGLIDEIGGIDRAIELVKERAKIGKDQKVTLVAYPPKRTFLEVMFGQSADTPIVETAIRARFGQMSDRILKHSWMLELFEQGGMISLMPYVIEVK